jgi:hypothetical protein
MTPMRKERKGVMYASSYHIWTDPVTPPAPFKREMCSACGLVSRRTWGAKHCKCEVNPK